MDDDDADPAAARVRRELARLADADSAPEAPPAVTARVGAALRAAGDRPAHSVRPPRLRRLQIVGLLVGLAALLAGVVLGTSMLAREPTPTLDTGPTAETITVAGPAHRIPLSDAQIVALLSRTPDYGPLADPDRRASCLNGLGYAPATPVLGARPIDIRGTAAVLLVLPGKSPGEVRALAVEPGCNAAHIGLLADTVVRRP